MTTLPRSADVVVVGAGPAGSATALHLARAGLDVVLLEKSSFPRDKICGDGLTPRAVKQLIAMGVDTSPEAGWARTRGLRLVGGGHRVELPWPTSPTWPSYGLVRRRTDLDEVLARAAAAAGAALHERVTVTGPVLDAAGRVRGVTTRTAEGVTEVAAPVVVACDGGSSRLATAAGRTRRTDRPMGVAVRSYYATPRSDDDWMESWIELWGEGPDGRRALLPGYGWIFGLGDGTANVGLGLLDSSDAFQNTDYRRLLRSWLDATPEEWGLREASRLEPVRGAALPMAFNRTPHYADGLLLVGDSGGMVNPFNGEGIDYALEAGAMAAEVVAAASARRTHAGRERELLAYPQALRSAYGGYFTLGRVFVRLIGDPRVLQLATRHGLPRPLLMRFVVKLLANLAEPRGGDAVDRVVAALTRLAPPS